MFKSSLAKTYAERFCGEYSDIKVKKRQTYFESTNSRGETIKFMNGEVLGPRQTWPAQIDDFSFIVSRNHAHRKINYKILKNIINLESPELTTISYESPEEYKDTMEHMFKACIAGMKHGKLERVYKREKKKRARGLKKVFINEEGLVRSIINSPKLKKRVENFRTSLPSYGALRNLYFDDVLLQEHRLYQPPNIF